MANIDPAEFKKFRAAFLGYVEAFGPTSLLGVQQALRAVTPCIGSVNASRFIRQLLLDRQIVGNGMGEYALTQYCATHIKRNGLL